jgi:pimeloyl-ACP methyl ester carboxylesterase
VVLMPIVRTTLWALAAGATIYAALCVLLFAVQRSLLYFPQPSAVNFPGSTLMLGVPGAELQVSVNAQPGSKALLYFGGNAEDVSLSLAAFSAAFPDRALYFRHYRGYGTSTGKPTEAGIHSDARALFDFVQRSHGDVAVIGRSLGTGVAVRLAAERPVSRLILVTPYDSIERLAAKQFPFFPIKWLLIDKLESWRFAPTIRAPTLLLAAAHDEVIPLESTQRLYACFAPGTATLVVVAHASHNTISDGAPYLATIRDAL